MEKAKNYMAGAQFLGPLLFMLVLSLIEMLASRGS